MRLANCVRLLPILCGFVGCLQASAATLTVDTTSDSASLTACTKAPNDCSLRGALTRAQDAALQPGDDLIHFDIPAATDSGCVAATGVCTITLTSSITAAMTTIAQGGLTVDGSTQPGASANTLPAGQGSNAVWKIELAGAAHTLGFQAPITIRGIAFRTGLLIQRVGGFCCGTPPGSGRYEIEGNAFGLLADGETPSPSPPGILLHLPVGSGNIDGARIGGGLPEQRNVFGSSGDAGAASECLRLSGTRHVVHGNLIGTDRSGTQARGCRIGILLDGSGIDIGGSGSGEGNLFAGHFNHALQINGSQPAGELKARIRGNSFGLAVDGVSPLPIGTNGVFSADLPTIRGDNGASQVRIGGVALGEGNRFANSGVGRPPAPSTPPHVQTSVTFRIGRWEVLGNRFVGNRGMGIDSTANGAGHRPNDAGDGDSSTGSKLQNFPVISASSLAGNQLDLTYRVDSAFAAVPAEGQSTYPLRVEFYKADGAAGSVLLGHDTYASAEAQTSKSITLTLPSGVSLSPEEVIVATATDSATVAGEPTASITGNTSEFSFYPLAGFSFVSLTPAVGPSGSAYTARVRLVAAAGVPFKPTGEVLIQDGRGGECIAQVLPVAAASTGEGECQLTTGGAPGIVTVTASYNSALNAFALPSGASPAIVSLTRTLREALVVDTTSDSAAAAFQACTAAPGDCSLRGALIKAQRDLAGEDSIHFDIPASDPACDGTGVCTITLSTDSIDLANLVPGIQTGPSQGFTIDGYTQPGASANTLPLGQGTNAQLKIKLVGPIGTARQIITHSPFTIRGLIFQNIALMHQRGDGGSGGNGHPADLRYQLYGNFFGIDADGTTGLDSPSLAGSSYVRTSNLIRGVRIGSGDPADSNLFGAGAQKPNFCLIVLGENRVHGNFIGTDRSGISGSGCQNGLQVSHQASPNRLPLDIGGSMPGQGNVIANHVGYAIDVIPTERDVLLRIRGNMIGIGVDGLTPAPNINFGSSACTPFAAIRGGFAQPGSAQIGGLAPGEGNLFGHNGVNRARCPAPFAAPAPYMQTVAAGEGMGVWQVQGNRYVGLEGMAIDLVQTNDPNNSQPQRLPNDAGDADPLGANRRQNFPTISAFGLAGNQVSLTYQVDSTPANSRYPLSIEFLKDDGQGNLTPIGHDTYTAGEAQTDKAIGFTLPAGVTLGSSDIVIATATTTGDTTPGENISGETSETSFYPLESFSLVSITPTTVPSGMPVTARVRAVAAAGVPFRPNGRVLVQASNGSSPFEECTALLAPVAAPRTSEGECQFTANAPPGNLGVRVSYDGARNSFALANGTHPPSVLQTITVRAPLVVDTTSDDGSAAFQACTAASGDCSLRGAILKANLDAAADSIQFDIPMSDGGCTASTGVCRIAPQSVLPTISQPLTLDGYSQAGASPNTIAAPGALDSVLKIEIDGTGVAAAVPAILNVSGAPVTLRGLAIGGVPSNNGTHAVNFGFSSAGSRIEGCYLGTDASGSVALPAAIGVRAEGTVFIGGDTPAARNLISGNRARGVELGDGVTTTAGGSIVQGNLIGTTRDGLTALANGLQGIRVFAACSAPFPLIGGIGAGNRIAGNNEFGLRWGGIGICSADGGGQVIGNVFGQAVDGSALGNRLGAIFVAAQGGGVDIGRVDPGAGNVIAHSHGVPGHGISSSRRFVRASGNRWFGNAGLAINGPIAAGRDPNDAGDADFLGTSRAQNAPAISAFSQNGNALSLSYRVDSEFDANAAATNGKSVYPITVDFYRAAGDEGEVWLGSDVYAAGEAQTVKPLTLTLPSGVSFGANDVLIATATDSQGNQSEFSFYLIDSLAILSDEPDPTPAGVPYTVTVRAQAAAGQLFAPNGQVRIDDGRGATCLATLVPTATPLRAEGSCELSSTGAPGTLTLTASLSAQDSAFALANGASVANATATHTLLAGVTALELVSGNNQSAPLGEAFGEALVVRTLGSGGAPVSGIPIQFSGPTTGAGASFEPQVPVSGADGLASTTASAIRAGGSYTVTARVGALTQAFALTNEPGLSTALAIVSNLPNPSNPGQAVTVTTALNPQAGGPAPTGAIAVSANTGESCTITLPASSCPLSFATLGTRQIQASYPGDANYRPSKAAFATQLVQPGPGLRIGDVSQNEGNGGTTDFVFTVTLDNALGGAVSVDFATANDSAVAPGDYASTSGTLSFSGTTTTRTITVAVAGDTVIEPDERFFVNLSNANGATLSRAQGIGTILNDDQPPPPAARIDDATVTEPVGEGEEVLARFRVHLDRPATSPVSVRVRAVSGTALAGTDFDTNDFVLGFAPGQRERVVEVFIRADGIVEATETFTVELSEPQGLTLADAVATGTIFDAAFDGVLTVTSAADPGDGNCTPADCTLREAISLGNTLQSVGIAFSIPGAGPHTIRPLTPLPIPAASIHTIDGYTQPGSRPNQLAAVQGELPQGLDAEQRIELDGRSLGAGSSGLTVLHGMTVRGLAIGGFAEAGIRVRTDGHRRPTRIVGNALGSDPGGALARPNGVGLRIDTTGAVLGTATPVQIGSVGGRPAAARNLISGNREAGIRVNAEQGVPQRLLHLDGNLIGLDAELRALPNGGPGIDLSLPAPNGLPGVLLVRNHIGGNGGSGIRVLSRAETLVASAGVLLSDQDLIGLPVANGVHGLELGGASASVQGLQFGGTRLGAHPQAAVRLLGPLTQASVTPNRLPAGPVPIDLGPLGATPNDPGDGDTGPNGLLNTPVAGSARFDAAGERVVLELTLDTPPQAGVPAPEVLVYAEDAEGLRRVGGGSLAPQGAGFAGTLTVLALPGGLRAGSSLRVQTRYGDLVSELTPMAVTASGQQLLAAAGPVREAAGALLRYTITLDGPITVPVPISYRTRDGSASAGLDYTAVNGSATLTPAQPGLTVEVPVLNDSLVEFDETVLLDVASAVAGVAAVSSTGLITDDDRLRQDRGQYDPILLDQLAGIDGFIVDHPQAENGRLLDLGDFNGDTRRDLMIGLDDRVQLLLGLARPVPALVSLPAAGSVDFPIIGRGVADVFDFGAVALGRLRGTASLPSLGLRGGVVHGRTAPLPASSTLAALAVPPDGAALSSELAAPLPIGDVNGDGRVDLLVQRLSGGNPRLGVIFGQPAGVPLPSTLAALDGSNGFVMADPNVSIRSVSMAGDVDGDGRADLLLRQVVGAGGSARAENRLILGRASWPASLGVPVDAPMVRSAPVSSRLGVASVAGDFNGDGFGDLAIAYASDRLIEVVFGDGSATGLGAAALRSVISGFQDPAKLQLAALPDLDGNRAADLAIGDTRLQDFGRVPSARVAVLYGRASWPSSVDLNAPPPTFVKVLDGPAGSRAPQHLAAIGDYNGDGLGELAITLSGRSYVLYSSEAMFSGGSETPPVAPPPASTRVLDGGAPAEVAMPGDDALELLSAGDLDGDGRNELLIGRSQPLATAGDRLPLLLVPGHALGASVELDLANPPAGSTRFRQSASAEGSVPHRFAAGGDFDGDGLADLAFLRYGNPVQLALLRGRSGGLPAFIEPVPQADLLLGFSGPIPNNARELRFLGDVDGDGFDDLGVLRGGPGQLAEVEVIFGRAPGAADRRATISAAPNAGLVLPNQPKLGRVRNGVAADAFVLGITTFASDTQVVVLGGPGFPASLNLNNPGNRAVRLSASHWRSPQDAQIVGLGDVTGDGIADLGVAHQPPSADGLAQGVVALIAGRASWPAQLSVDSSDPTLVRGRIVLRGGAALDTLITGLAALPDQNGDGRRELLISLGLSGALGTGSGRVLLLHGPALPAGTQTELVINGALAAGQGINLLNSRGAPALQFLQLLGDIDGDGRPELIGGSVPDDVSLQGLRYRGLPSLIRGSVLQAPAP